MKIRLPLVHLTTGSPRQTRAAELQPADVTKNISEMKIRPSWCMSQGHLDYS
jgi:hypothetical protein